MDFLPLVRPLALPFILKGTLDGVSYWALDRITIAAERADDFNRPKKLLFLAARIGVVAFMVFSAYAAFQGIIIGYKMLSSFLVLHKFTILSHILPLAAPILLTINILNSLFIISMSMTDHKRLYRQLREIEVENERDPLSLKEWIHFSFLSLNPFFSTKVDQARGEGLARRWHD